MFLINQELQGINLYKQDILSLKFSKNIISVSTPNDVVAPARSYIVTMVSSEGCSVYIILIFTEENLEPIFFEFHENPVSEDEALTIEDDALSFVEDMGFEMEQLAISQMDSGDVEEWISKIDVFYIPHPTGDIQLQISEESLVADGKSRVIIESQPILDSDGDIVQDATIFKVTASQGIIINESTDESGNPLNITSRSGSLSFVLQSSTEIGLSTVQVRSQTGNAKGVTKVVFVPGEPDSSIEFLLLKKQLIADGKTTIPIETAPISDPYGNHIADGSEFLVSCSDGLVLDPASRQGGAQAVISSQGSIVKFLYKVGKKAGDIKIKIKSQTGKAAGQCKLALIAGYPAGDIVLIPSVRTLQVDDDHSVTIESKIIHDSQNNAVIDGTAFTVSTTTGSLIGSDDQSGKKITVKTKRGQLSFIFQKGNEAGEVNIRVESEQGDAKGSCLISINAGGASGDIMLKAEPSELNADGKSMSRIFSATSITDKFGNIVEDDTPISVHVDRGKLVGLPAGDIALTKKGKISFEYLSPTLGERATISVSGPKNKARGTLEIALIALDPVGQITLKSSSANLVANESDECEITSDTIYNSSGNPVSDGTTIELETNLGEFISFDGNHEGKKIVVRTIDGSFTSRIRAGNKRGTMVIKATSSIGTAQGEMSIPVLSEAPEGSIELIPEKKMIVADGKSRVWIASDPITDAHDNIVDDDTFISIETDKGTIVGDEIKKTDEGLQIPTRNGIIRFQLKSDTKVGSAQVTAISVDGFAMGAADVTFVSGIPHGKIELAYDKRESPRTDSGSILITSKPITDLHDNIVDDTCRFSVSVISGSLYLTPDDEGNSELEVVSKKGTISFYFKAGSRATEIPIIVRSLDNKDCQGQLAVFIRPGLPASFFELTPDREEYFAGEDKAVEIKSTIITDAFDNPIEDGLDFLVRPEKNIILLETENGEQHDTDLIVHSHEGRIAFLVMSNEPSKIVIDVQSFQGDAKGSITLDFKSLPPSGSIDLIPEATTIIADGESTLQVISDQIKNSVDQIVPDGTEFSLIVENGFAFTDDMEQATNEISLKSSDGKIVFHVISSFQIGFINCSVSSNKGDAKGSCQIELIPGPPHGFIELKSSKEMMMAGDFEPVTITSEMIKDRNNNTVQDGTILSVSCSHGLITKDLQTEWSDNAAVSIKDGVVSFFAKAGQQPGMLRLEIDSDDHGARGELDIPLEQPPVQDNISLHTLSDELIADGKSLVEMKSGLITDIFGNPLPDQSVFTILIEGGVGLNELMDEPLPQFSVYTQEGLVSFLIQSPRVSGEVTVKILTETHQVAGERKLVFEYPYPTGEIVLTSSAGLELTCDTQSTITIRSEPLITDKEIPVQDGEKFLVSTTMGGISFNESGPQKEGLVIHSSEGIIEFSFHLPQTPGQAIISVSSDNGDATGQLVLTIITGKPSGTIILKSDRTKVIAGEPEPVCITSDPISDKTGNIVADGIEVFAQCQGGMLSQKDEIDWQENRSIIIKNGILEFIFRPNREADHCIVSVYTDDRSAEGKVEFSVERAPLKEIVLDTEHKMHIADGTTTVEIRSQQISDVYGNPVPDGKKFTVSIEGSIGLSHSMTDAMTTFEVTTINGIVDFQVLPISDTGQVHVRITSEDEQTKGELILKFQRPKPVKPIIIQSLNGNTLVADEQTKVTIQTEQIQTDQEIPVLDGEPFFISASDGIIIAENSAPRKDGVVLFSQDGYLSFKYRTSLKVGPVTISIKAINGDCHGDLTLELIAGCPSGTISLYASPEVIFSDDRSPITITSDPIKDSHDHIISDTELFRVFIEGARGCQKNDNCDQATDQFELNASNGLIDFIIIPDENTDKITVHVEANNEESESSGSLILETQPAQPTGRIELQAEHSELIADGKSTTTISSGIINTAAGKPVEDGTLFLVSSDRGSISAPQGQIAESGITISSVEGKVIFSLRASKKTGNASLSIKSKEGDAVGTMTVPFVAGLPARNIGLIADPIMVAADGVSEIAISCNPITDAFGNVVEDGIIVNLETDLGELIKTEQVVGDPFSTMLHKGTFSAILRAPTQSGVATVIAWTESGNAIGNLEISFTPGPPMGTISILPSKQDIRADGEDTAMLTTLPLKDKFSNFIADSEIFDLIIKTPSGETVQHVISPKSAKLEFIVPPQEQDGAMTVNISSKNGKAEGDCTLQFKSVEEGDEIEEWFFAESEDDLLSGHDESSISQDDELQISIEDSFSRLVSSEPQDQSMALTDDHDVHRSDFSEETIIAFYRFMAGF